MKKIFETIKNSKNLIIVIILTLGLILTVISIQSPSILKYQAGNDQPVENAFEMKDQTGNQIVCDGDHVCHTDSLQVQIKLKDLQPLVR